jgi:hypothetical protein
MPKPYHWSQDEFTKHYIFGDYTSSNSASKGSIFTSTFSIENGQWQSLFEGTDVEYSCVAYSLNASGSAHIAYTNGSDSLTRKYSGSETIRTSTLTEWSTISGTKQTIHSTFRYDLERKIGEKSTFDTHATPTISGVTYVNHNHSESSRTVNFVINDIIVTDANNVQQRTYANNVSAQSSIYVDNHSYSVNDISWYTHLWKQDAVLTKTSPSANYTVSNEITHYLSHYNRNGCNCGKPNGTETVNYCDISLSGSSINSHYTHGV